MRWQQSNPCSISCYRHRLGSRPFPHLLLLPPSYRWGVSILGVPSFDEDDDDDENDFLLHDDDDDEALKEE